MSERTIKWNAFLEKIWDKIIRSLAYGLIIIFATVAVIAVSNLDSISRLPLLITGLFGVAYEKFGIALFGLLPIYVGLAALMGRQILHHTGIMVMTQRTVGWYKLIENAAPVCGIIGTFTGLGESLSEQSIDMSAGILKIIASINIGIGEAIISSIAGLIAALLAIFAIHVYEHYPSKLQEGGK